MKTLLIPVDFTPASANAISYAVEWSKAYGYERIILFKTLYDSMYTNLVPCEGYMNEGQDYLEREREETIEKMNELSRQLIQQTAPGIKVMLAVSHEPVVRAVLQLVATESPELIVTGSDHNRYSGEGFVGDKIISIARLSPVRVLIVPLNYTYQSVEQALVPVDFNTVESLSKLDSYQAASPLWNKKKLLVLNVDPKEKYLNPDERFRNAENALHQYLQNFPHQLFYSNNKNIIDSIVDFGEQHPVQIIIALPGKYSFLSSLTHKSISEAIYENTKKPVLILK